MATDPPKISFARLVEEDLELLHRWLNEPHVRKWWDADGCTREQVEEKYRPRLAGQVPVFCFFVLWNDLPVGYIQCYWLADFPDYKSRLGIETLVEPAACLDVFIGDAASLAKGIGTKAIGSFLLQVVFGELAAGSCLVGPDLHNEIAINAYRKSGFVYLKTVEGFGGDSSEYLMLALSSDFLA